MKKRKLKKSVKWILVLAVLAAGTGLFLLLKKAAEKPVPSPVPTAEVTPEPTPEPTPVPKEEWEFEDDRLLELKKEFADDLAVDGHLQGILCFQSGLVHQPVFQGTDNDYYLYHAWETGEYRSWGSICMEYTCDYTKDQNCAIYGHYVYPERTPDRTVMFTPLAKLLVQENYEDNKYLAMALEDEIVYYEIIYVYNCHLLEGEYIPEDLMYDTPNFTEHQYEKYRARLKECLYYDTGKDLDYPDRFITLQTCIEGAHLDREIIICREIERKPYPEI